MNQPTPPPDHESKPGSEEPAGHGAPDPESESADAGGSGAEGESPSRNPSRERIEENIKSKSTWLRLFFIVFFAILYGVAEFVLTVVVVVQFLWALINGESNPRLRMLGQSLATYNYEIVRYLTYNTDERPFPIDLDWPSGSAEGEYGPDGI